MRRLIALPAASSNHLSVSLFLSLSLSPVRDTRVWLMYVARNHSMHLALRYWLVIPSLSLFRSFSLSLSLSLPFHTRPVQPTRRHPPTLNAYAYLYEASFNGLLARKLIFHFPVRLPFRPPTRYIYLHHKRTLPPSSLTFRKLCYFFSFLFLTFLIHSLYEALFSRPKNPIPLRGSGIKVATSGTSAFHRKPRMEIARRGQGYRNRIIVRRTRYER